MLDNNVQYPREVDLRVAIIKSLILLALLMITGYLVPQIIRLNSLDTTPAANDISQRTLAASEFEEEIVYVNLSNQRELFELLPTVSSAVANQVYSEHYKQTGRLERTAEVVGSVQKRGDAYTFATRFLPSTDIMDTAVTMTDDNRGLYTIDSKWRNDE